MHGPSRTLQLLAPFPGGGLIWRLLLRARLGWRIVATAVLDWLSWGPEPLASWAMRQDLQLLEEHLSERQELLYLLRELSATACTRLDDSWRVSWRLRSS